MYSYVMEYTAWCIPPDLLSAVFSSGTAVGFDKGADEGGIGAPERAH